MLKKIFILTLISISITARSQTSLTPIDCNSLEVYLYEDVSSRAKVFLEKEILNDVWVKISEIETDENQVIFGNLESGLYRSTYIPKGILWDKNKYISNKAELNCKESNLLNKSFSIRPNPANETLTIEYNTKILKDFLTYQIINESGVVIQQDIEHNTEFKIPVSKLNSGVYFIKIINDGIVNLQKLVIAH